jgi:ABC-type maltose transport system permease subunit
VLLEFNSTIALCLGWTHCGELLYFSGIQKPKKNPSETNWGNLMAASVLICIPVFILFLFVQRQLVGGLTQGAVKG